MPYVAVFTDHGKLVAFTDNRDLVGMVSRRMGEVLPPAEGAEEKILTAARKKILSRLSETPDGDGK